MKTYSDAGLSSSTANPPPSSGRKIISIRRNKTISGYTLKLSGARMIYTRRSSRIENQTRRLAPRFNTKFEYLFMNVNNVFTESGNTDCENIVAGYNIIFR